MSETTTWLNAGIAALQAGNKAEAEVLLMRVVQADGENERAWLWLSDAVEADADRRICLENVLTINPDNAAAQRKLRQVVDQLDAIEERMAVVAEDEPELADDEEYIIIPPTNLAAALLYPNKRRRKKEAATAVDGRQTAVSHTSTFDDVWSHDDELCGYCAHVVEPDDEKCPHCGRKLYTKVFKYEKVDGKIHFFWIFLLSTASLFALQGFFIASNAGEFSALSVIGFVLAGMYMMLAIAAYYRQAWAHYMVIYLTISILFISGLNGLIALIVPDSLKMGLGESSRFFSLAVFVGLQKVFAAILLVMLLLTLVFALFFVAADFVRDKKRQTAVIQPGLNAADRYDGVARKHAQAGRWATAVLHWQRAAAKDPTRLIYQRRLASGYARLGFHERSLGVLNNALAVGGNAEMIGQLKRMKTAVERQLKK